MKPGFYDQHHEDLNPKNDILTEIADIRPDMKQDQIRGFMGRFLFTGQDIFKSVEALSGGERARVSIAKLILQGANLLYLDEPTNHLDIASREALENALSQYPGSIVLVSHDRALIDKLVEKLVVMADGTGTVFEGNYTHYRWKLGKDSSDRSPDAGTSEEEVMKIRRVEKKVAPKQRDKEAKKEQRRLERRLKELEEQIEAMEEHIGGFELRFTQVDPADYEANNALQVDYDGLKRDLKEMYGEWETLSEEVGE